LTVETVELLLDQQNLIQRLGQDMFDTDVYFARRFRRQTYLALLCLFLLLAPHIDMAC
jgi:hypothetical protein